MKITSFIAFILVIIGALNWLLIGLFSVDVVAIIFGVASIMSRIIYSLVGLAGLWMIFYLVVANPLKTIS